MCDKNLFCQTCVPIWNWTCLLQKKNSSPFRFYCRQIVLYLWLHGEMENMYRYFSV